MESIGRDDQGGEEEEEDHAGGTGDSTTTRPSAGAPRLSAQSEGVVAATGCYCLLLTAEGSGGGIREDSSTQHSYTIHSRSREAERAERGLRSAVSRVSRKHVHIVHRKVQRLFKYRSLAVLN